MSIESKIKNNFNLKNLTTYRIGGDAKHLIEINTKEELKDVFTWLDDNNEDFFVLAGGSNVLVNNKLIDALIIKLVNNKIDIKGERLECGAGASLPAAVNLATGNSLSGIEWAAGIPGSIGGAIRGNAGASKMTMSDLVETVEIFDVENKKFKVLSRKECVFTYRSSLFREQDNKKKYIIWKTVLRLKRGSAANIKKEVNALINERSKTNPRSPSAGCVFKNFLIEYVEENNPTLAKKAIEEKVVQHGMIPAGWVIDHFGFKGKKIGNAKVSLEHANFIINTGNAQAQDVVMLISFIKQQVRDKYKIQLQEEIEYLGF